MLGGIVGDVIGSAYEAGGYKRYDFELYTEYSKFTDDTVMTVAIAEATLRDGDYRSAMLRWGARYPSRGYGKSFEQWLIDPSIDPYSSWGNGGAMRVSPIGLIGSSLGAVLDEARRSAELTHNHPEGIKGAQAAAACVYLARDGSSKAAIRTRIARDFGYDLGRTVEAIRPGYTFAASSAKSVPESIICFLGSEDFESAIRNAVSLGGDTDTMACISGSIAHAYYGAVPDDFVERTRERLPDDMLEVVDEFSSAVAGGG